MITSTAPHKQGGFLIPERRKMDNKKLPLVEELKSIVFDFEHGKYTVNNCDVGHCSEISVIFHDGYWHIFVGATGNSVTLKYKKTNN